MMKQLWAADHLAAGVTAPVDLRHNAQYKAAMEMAKTAALPDKGERPDRDPQVRSLRGWARGCTLCMREALQMREWW